LLTELVNVDADGMAEIALGHITPVAMWRCMLFNAEVPA